MGEIFGTAAGDAFHRELCAAIADLAKSVDVAVTRMALRAKCTAAIADAAKVERAAEALRAAALEAEPDEPQEITLVPAIQTVEKTSQASASDHQPSCTAADELYVACSWLATTQSETYRPESMIAMRIVELQDRLGGLIKK
jgi:hypothetical protein